MFSFLKKQTKAFCALDIGSHKLTAVACPVSKEGPQLGDLILETEPSRGIFKGVVNDVEALSEAIEAVLKRVQKRARLTHKHILVGVGGSYIVARHSRYTVALTETDKRVVMNKDIRHLIRQARILGLEAHEQLLHEFPLTFSIDKDPIFESPVGLRAQKLGVDLLLVCANTSYLDDISKSVEKAGFFRSKVFFSGLAAAEAVLSAEEKSRGVIFMDIGDSLTEVFVYENGVPRQVHVFSFGGRNLTEVIAHYFKIPFEVAEEVKQSFLEIGRDIPDEQEVMVQSEGGCFSVKKKELMEIVSPEVDQFLNSLKNLIASLSNQQRFLPPLVVTGGVSLLEGLLEKMERDLQLPIKMGVVRGLHGFSSSKTPSYASAVGLLYLWQNLYKGKNGFRGQQSLYMCFQRWLRRLSDLYEDYF